MHNSYLKILVRCIIVLIFFCCLRIRNILGLGANTQQFRFRGAAKGVNEIALGTGTSAVYGVENQRLENKINELTTMVRHLAIGQQQVSAVSEQPARVCGICTSTEHPTDSCPTLQETDENVSGIYTNQQQQYALHWRDHPNLKWGVTAAAAAKPTTFISTCCRQISASIQATATSITPSCTKK